MTNQLPNEYRWLGIDLALEERFTHFSPEELRRLCMGEWAEHSRAIEPTEPPMTATHVMESMELARREISRSFQVQTEELALNQMAYGRMWPSGSDLARRASPERGLRFSGYGTFPWVPFNSWIRVIDSDHHRRSMNFSDEKMEQAMMNAGKSISELCA